MGVAIPPAPPVPPKLTGDPIKDNQTYYEYQTKLYTHGIGVSMFDSCRQTSAKQASEGKKINEYCPLSGR